MFIFYFYFLQKFALLGGISCWCRDWAPFLLGVFILVSSLSTTLSGCTAIVDSFHCQTGFFYLSTLPAWLLLTLKVAILGLRFGCTIIHINV